MRNYFVYDGRPSTDFNTYIAESNMFDAAERDVESVKIPGRSGTLTIDRGRFENFICSLHAFIPDEMSTNLDGLRNWLLSKSGYCRYEENSRPGEYRMARYTGPFTVSQSDRNGATFDLIFNCKPQRFLVSGETAIEFTADGAITNPTVFEAKPIIRIYGAGTVGIGDVNVTFDGSSEYVDLDCELQDAYYGPANKNSSVTLDPNRFPVIPASGAGIVLGSGITQVDITPRWFEL